MAHHGGEDHCAYTRCKRHFELKTGDTIEDTRVACVLCCPDCKTERQGPYKLKGQWYVGDVELATAACGHAAIFCNGCIQYTVPNDEAIQQAALLNCGVGARACCCSSVREPTPVVTVLADGTIVRAASRAELYTALRARTGESTVDTEPRRRPQISADYERPQRCEACHGVKYLCDSCTTDVVEHGEYDKSQCASCCCQRPVAGAILPNGEYARGTRDEMATLIADGVDMNGTVIVPMTIEE